MPLAGPAGAHVCAFLSQVQPIHFVREDGIKGWHITADCGAVAGTLTPYPIIVKERKGVRVYQLLRSVCHVCTTDEAL